MVMFLALHPMESISLNSFVLLDTDFNTRNKLLTQNFLNNAISIINFAKPFLYYDLLSKFQVRLKSILHQGLSEPEFYGDLVYKLKKIVASNNFQRSSLIKRLAILLMYCSILHAR